MDNICSFCVFVWPTAEDTCGGTFRGSSGTISSPDFQKDYQSSGECTWTVLADPGDTISLVFTEFQMDSKLDSLEVEGSDPPTIWWVWYWIVASHWFFILHSVVSYCCRVSASLKSEQKVFNSSSHGIKCCTLLSIFVSLFNPNI